MCDRKQELGILDRLKNNKENSESERTLHNDNREG